jgi:hypothetical protein
MNFRQAHKIVFAQADHPIRRNYRAATVLRARAILCRWLRRRPPVDNIATMYVLAPDGSIVRTRNVLVWGATMEDWRYGRMVAHTRIGTNGSLVEVTTVFLGLDGHMGMDPPPRLFGTAILKNGKVDEVEQYPDIRAARRGHAFYVDMITRGDQKTS